MKNPHNRLKRIGNPPNDFWECQYCGQQGTYAQMDEHEASETGACYKECTHEYPPCEDCGQNCAKDCAGIARIKNDLDKRPSLLKQVLVFPTWMLLGIMRPFLPEGHLWKHQKFGLKRWALGSTGLNREISLMLWISFLGFIYCIVVIIILS